MRQVTLCLFLLIAFSLSNAQFNEFLDGNIILADDEPVPYSYCTENFVLSVESLTMSNHPTSGVNTTSTIKISGKAVANATSTSVVEIITLNGVQISNKTIDHTEHFIAGKDYEYKHLLEVKDTAAKGSYNCKITIRNAKKEGMTCAQVGYAL